MHVNAPPLHHWGYGAAAASMPATPQSHWVPPPQSHSHQSHQSHQSHHSHNSLKRALSESDCDELYSEESSKEQCVCVNGNLLHSVLTKASLSSLFSRQNLAQRHGQLPADEPQEASRRHREEASRSHQLLADRAEASGAFGLRETGLRQAGEGGDSTINSRALEEFTIKK